MDDAARRSLLADLRVRVGRLEHGPGQRKALAFGVDVLDRHLPAGGIARGAVHEVVAAGIEVRYDATSILFTAEISARLEGPVLWTLRRRDLFAPALAHVGLSPDRLLFAETWREGDVLPVVEEGLRQAGLAAVGEVARFGLMSSRRLQLAAEKSGVTAFMLRRLRSNGVEGQEPTAALTRWRVTPLPSAPLSAPGLGRARWRLDLLRCKGGEPAAWIVDACDGQGRLAVAADLADRPSARVRAGRQPATPRS